MAIFTEPKKWGVIPGSAADVGEIQEESNALYPSIADLWPAIYQLALSKGGKAPERTSFNAFLKMIMGRLYFYERGGVYSYDATADYPAGAVVGYSGSLYLALKDNGGGTDAGAVTPGKNTSVWQKLVLESELVLEYYTKSEIDTKLDSKANTSDLSNYYTKSEVDNLLSNISVYSITNEEIEEICVL